MKHPLLAAFIASVALGASAPVRAQDAWLWQNPKPTLMDFNSVHFPAAQTASGWAVGNGGTIFRTGNGGNTWTQFTGLTTSANLESVWFSILNSGWAVGAGGTILKATSLGNTWTAQTSGVSHDLKGVHALNSNSGWAVGYSGTTGVILRTTNGGTTWTNQTYPQARFTAVRIIDSFVGYAVGLGGVIYKTADGGNSWFALTSGTTADLRGLHFSGADTGFVVGDGGLIRYTADGGFSWSTRSSGTTRTLTAIGFSTASKGWISGDSGLVLRTTNGGVSWTASTNGTAQLRAVQGIGDTVFSVGATGRLLRSYNAGVTWTALSSGVVQTVNAMSFPTASTGYAAGPAGGLLKSTDYGANWNAVTMTGGGLAGLNVTALHFPSATVGYAVGAGGVMMKSLDGGMSWTAVPTGTTNNLNAVYFQTVDRGFIAGNGGLVRVTVDGGANWTTPTVPTTTQNFLSIAFATPAVGWVAGGTALRKTIDSGKTWTTQGSGSGSNPFIALSVVDTQHVIVVRQTGIYRTRNGGANWTSVSASGNGTFRAGYFVTPAQGYIVNATGSVGVTTDSGASWEFQPLLPTTHALNTVLMAPGGRIFAAGTDGAIMKLRPPAPTGFYYNGSPFVFGNGQTITPVTPSYNGVVSTFTITPALPAGLTFDSLTGVIAGKPVAAQSTTTHSVAAYNETAHATFSISVTVRNQITSIQYPASQLTLGRGTAMTPLTPVVVGVEPFGPYNCTSNPPLPAGLSLEPLTCVLSGTPANAQSGVNYIITASNGFTPFNKADTLRITVAAPPSNLTYSNPQPTYTVGQAITPNTATVTVVTGASLKYSVAPALPAGLVIDSVTGTISGTPTKAAAATAHTVTVTSSAGSTTGSVNITVNGPPANVTYPAVVFGVGVPDTARGTPAAVGPVTRWSITPPPPAGLIMDTLTGKFSGMAEEAVSGSAHTVTAHNQYGSGSVAMTISVLNPIVLFNYPTKNFTLVAGSPMTAVSPIVAGAIPFTPVTYSVSPALPAGITLNTATGTISGTPTTGSQLMTRHTVTARNGVAAFNKADTLTFLVQTTSLRHGRAGGVNQSLLLDGRAVALAPPEGTRTLRVALHDMSGRLLLDRTVDWTGAAHLRGVRAAAAGNGIMVLSVRFLDEGGRPLGRFEQRVPVLAP